MRSLFVAHRPPWPPQDGGRQRSFFLFRALQKLGEVDLLLLDESGEGLSSQVLTWGQQEADHLATAKLLPPQQRSACLEQLQLWGFKTLAYYGESLWPASRFAEQRSLSEMVQGLHAQRDYDVFVGRYLLPSYVAGLHRVGPTIVDVDDLPSLQAQREARGKYRPWQERLVRWWEHKRLRKFESQSKQDFEALWVPAREDLASLPPQTGIVLPNIPFEPPEHAPASTQDTPLRVLFVGSLNYEVNQQGLEYFLRQVWPSIHKRTRAQFRIVGKGDNTQVRQLAAQTRGATLVGFAEDLKKEYQQATITVAPLQEGGGTKIKVLESLAYGRVCVATQHAARGFDKLVGSQQGVESVATTEQFIESCCQLLKNPGRRQWRAQQGQKEVQKHYSFQHFADVVAQTVEDVLSNNLQAG